MRVRLALAIYFSILQPVIRWRHYVLTGCVEHIAYIATVKKIKGPERESDHTSILCCCHECVWLTSVP